MNEVDKKRFDYLKELYPDYSDEQLWTMVSLNREISTITKAKDVEISGDIIEMILRAAERWLEQQLPKIFEKVEGFFRDALDHIGEWVMNGIEYLAELIRSWF